MKRFAWNVCLACLMGAFSGCGDDEPRRRGEITVTVENAAAGTVELVYGAVVVGRQDFDAYYSRDVRFSAGQLDLKPGDYQIHGIAENGRKASRTLAYKGGFADVVLDF